MTQLRPFARALSLLALLAAHVCSNAAATEVDRGVAWLSRQAQADGTLAGESRSAAIAFQARQETLTTLRQLSTAPLPLVDQVSSDSTVAVEMLARKARALSPLGRDVSTTVSALLARQNADGGWGGAQGYQSNALDTAHALLALKQAAPTQSAAIGNGIAYLRSAQAADGSFNLVEPASVYVTSESLQALAAFATLQGVGTSISLARAWLINKQQLGVYSDTLSNAVAILGLLSSSTDTTWLAGAAGALRAAQLADDSWNADPYLTAVVLRALAAVGELMPATTGQLSGAVVESTSGAAIGGAQVQISGPQSASASSDAAGAFSFGNLAPGSYTLDVSKAGYSSASLAVTITAGVTTRIGSIRLEVATTTATLQGIVRDGSTGLALAGATVEATPGSIATTDASGNYRISGLAPGAVSLTASKTGYTSVVATATLVANVVYTFSPSLYATGQGPNDTGVKGRVVDRATGAAVAGASVKIGTATATTSATGDFSLSGLSAGAITVEVSAAGYQPASLSGTIVQGTNDLGTIPLDKAVTSITVSGRISDAASNLPIGGAVVAIRSSTLSATTNSNGFYTIAGVTQASFTLDVSAAGYQARSVSATLAVFADATIDAALSKVASGSLSLLSVATNSPSYPPYSAIEIDAKVQNLASLPADVTVSAAILDAGGARVVEMAGLAATIPGGTFKDVEFEAHNNAMLPGTYSVLVRVADAAGNLQAEGSASFQVLGVAQVAGDVSVDPPIVQSGSGQSVRLKANLSNYGNLAIAAGKAELTVTLVNPEPGVGTAPRIELLPGVTAGDPLAGPLGAGFDAAGNFYTVSTDTRAIVKITPAGVMSKMPIRMTPQSAPVDALPATLTSPSRAVYPVDVIVDAAGNVSILNNASEIFTVAADGTFSRRQTGILDTQVAFDRDAAGTFHILTTTGGTKITALPVSGAVTVYAAGGLSAPRGMVRSTDGMLYVTNSDDKSISQVASDGTITPWITKDQVGNLLNSPYGITSDAAGDLYVANYGDGKVIKVSRATKAMQVYASGMYQATDVRFDAQGNLFVSASYDVGLYKVASQGAVPEVFARTLASGPQGMQYDSAGNLYVGNGTTVYRKDAADNLKQVYFGLCNGREIAVRAVGEAFAASSCGGNVVRISGDTGASWASGLSGPTGLALGPGGALLYVTESSANRIVSLDAAAISNPAKSTVAQSLINTPKAVRIAANGDRYVLNADSIAMIPASGTAGSFTVTGAFGSAAVSLGLATDGTQFVQMGNSVQRLGTGGWTATGLPTLAYGIVPDASGSALVGDTVSKKIVRVGSAGVLGALSSVAFATAPTAIADDTAGGAFAALSSGHLARVDASGAVQTLTTTALSPVPNRLAYDPLTRRLYFLNGAAGVRYATLDANFLVSSVGSLSGVTQTFSALDFSADKVYLTDATARELRSIGASTGQSTSIAAGFSSPQPIVWNGSQLIFSDSTNTYSLVPGGNPTVFLYERFTHLAWRDGTLYGTRADANIYAYTPGDAASRVHLTPDSGGKMEGLAFRGDGLLTVASSKDDSAWSFAPGNSSPVATYAGMGNVQSLTLDAAGNVYVGSFGNSSIVRVPPSGRQSAKFASGIGPYSLAFGSDGTLYATTSNAVVGIDSSGAKQTLATGGQALRGVVADASGPVVVDMNTNTLSRVSAGQLASFAVGILTPKAVRADPSGGVVISSNGNGTVVKLANGSLSVRASGLPVPQGLAFLAGGQLVVGSSQGHVHVVDANRNATNVGHVGAIYGYRYFDSFPLDSMAVNAAGNIFAVSRYRNEVERIAYFPAGSGPQAGTVVLTTPLLDFPEIGIGATALPLDFGSWTPPYAGDFQVRVRPVGTMLGGEANNMLHVGPHATAAVAAVPNIVAPGTPEVNVTVNVNGADFTSIARPDPRSISTLVPSVSFVSTMGIDASGRVYVGYSNQLRRYKADGTYDVFHQFATGTFNYRGEIPVDDSQNVYVANARDLIRVAPVPGATAGAATTIATMPESILGMARASDNTLYVFGAAGLYHVSPVAGQSTWRTDTVMTFGRQPVYMTVDAKDNVYFLDGSYNVNVLRADGTRENLVRPLPEGAADADPTFEFEGGPTIAGDCADNLFMAPNAMKQVGLNGEESMLIHIIGSTGRPSSIFNGAKTRPQLIDMDGIVFDRFSSSMLVWGDSPGQSTGPMFRLPVTCGAIDTDLHMVFPAAQDASGFSVTPKAIVARADGSREYVWGLKDVTRSGKSVAFRTTLPGMQYGEVRPAASDAYLTFVNGFGNGTDEIRVPVEIPTVRADSRVTLSAVNDGSQYGANTVVSTTVTLDNANVATAISGTLAVEFTDAQGSRIAMVSQQAVSIPAASAIAPTAGFNTGTYLAGAYTIKATLTSAAGIELARGSAPFYIVAPGVPLVPSVSTDKPTYDASATVNIAARVRNVSFNSVESGLAVQVKVRNPSGQEIFSNSANIATLVPQALQNALFPLKLDRAPAGNYEVELVLLKGGAALGAPQYADFSVLSTADSGTGLAGAVSATREVAQGDVVTITATLQNQGNSTLTDMGVVIQVIDPQGGRVVQEWTDARVTIAAQGASDVTRSWSTTTGTATGTYVAVARANVSGRDIPIGQDSTRVTPDLTPDPFSFAPQTDVALSTTVVSQPVTIAGITAPVPVQVAGGEYSLDGVSWTAAAGTVVAGSVVRVRLFSASTLGTTRSATLTVSGVSAAFNVTTTFDDRIPDDFSFAPVTNAPLASWVVSAPATISGISVQVPISVANGEYSINGAPFTAAAGLVGNGETVTVRTMSSASFLTQTAAVVDVSGVSAEFRVTTAAEDRTPDAFSFAPKTNVALQAQIASSPAVVSGINTRVPITVAGGEYSVNGGSFTAVEGTVANGDSVVVRVTSSSSFAATTSTTLTIAGVSATFSATTADVANLALAFAFTAETRLLVLISCENSQGNSDPVCVEDRRVFLGQLLTSMGVDFKLSTETDAFKVEMRSGRYNTYWISGGAAKLGGTISDEVREAAFRGEAFIADGFHDDRNGFIQEVFGVNYGGRLTGLSTVVLGSTFTTQGTFTFSGDPIDSTLFTAVKRAGFDSLGGKAAIMSNTYGAGSGMLFAFDLVATLMAQPNSTLIRATLDQSIDYTLPAVPGIFTAGAYVPFSIVIDNREPVPVDVQVIAALANFELRSSSAAPASSVPGETRWTATIPANGSITLSWAYSAPAAVGTLTGTLTVNHVYGGTPKLVGTSPMSVTVQTLESVLPPTIQQIQALSLTTNTETQSRDRAVSDLQQAQSAIVAAQYESALSLLVDAVDQLDAVTSVPVTTYRIQIDRVIQEVGRRWYLALPPCPAPTLCR